MKLDLHNFSLEDAKEEICYSLDECREKMEGTLEIVHGHKHGTAIRDYIRSDRFLNDIAKIGHKIASKNFTDAGASIFRLSLKSSKIIDKPQTSNIVKSKDKICHKCNKLMISVEGLNWIKCPTCGKFQKR
jgi:hypothetical protein